MRLFEKYSHRAMILVGSDEYYNELLSKHEQNKSDYFTNLINDMKGIQIIYLDYILF
jgi:hypothetical protein